MDVSPRGRGGGGVNEQRISYQTVMTRTGQRTTLGEETSRTRLLWEAPSARAHLELERRRRSHNAAASPSTAPVAAARGVSTSANDVALPTLPEIPSASPHRARPIRSALVRPMSAAKLQWLPSTEVVSAEAKVRRVADQLAFDILAGGTFELHLQDRCEAGSSLTSLSPCR